MFGRSFIHLLLWFSRFVWEKDGVSGLKEDA